MLLSGGPPMTVVKLRYGQAECAWFDSGDNLIRGWFDVATLKKVSS